MKTALKWSAAIVIGLLLWQAGCALLGVPRYVLPRPTAVWTYAMANWTILLADLAVTGIEAVTGFCISIALSWISATLIYFAPRSERVFAVSTVGAQSIPILAIAPFLTSWFGSGIGSKVAASAIVCVFPLMGGWIAGRNSITASEEIFADSVLPTPWARLWHFILPRSLPAFAAAAKVGCPLSVLGALVGEFVGARGGLGFRILTGSYYLRTEEMVCGVMLACGLSLALFLGVFLLERKWLFWHGKSAT